MAEESPRRFSARQVTLMVMAVCAAVVGTPALVWAASASFTSSSASTPAVAGTNSSGYSGAKGVYGNASATSGTIYGVLGHSGSGSGYGVYSSGRLGSSGALVCNRCVSPGDAATSFGQASSGHYTYTWTSGDGGSGTFNLAALDGIRLQLNCQGWWTYGHANLYPTFTASQPGTLDVTETSRPNGATSPSTYMDGTDLIANAPVSSNGTLSGPNPGRDSGSALWVPTTGPVVSITWHAYLDSSICRMEGTISGPQG